VEKIALGIMSGTSGDGISLALAAFQKRRIEILHYETYPYPKAFSKKIRRLSNPPRTVGAGTVSKFNFELGHLFAKAVTDFLHKARMPASRVAVIGSHGHTVYHGPRDTPRHTLQLGEASVIAEATGIPVVADFRCRDIAAGGQGAPLIPFFDHYFFGNGPVRALQNIGGMANVTLVGKNTLPLAFDNGPGNALIDWAIQRHTRGKQSFDKDGRLGGQGVIDLKAVRAMASHPYFFQKPPKSTGRELFNESFLPDSVKRMGGLNLIATLTYFTAYSIHESYRRFLPVQPAEIIVSGGGALNQTLMGHLSGLFHPARVLSIQSMSMPARADRRGWPVRAAAGGLSMPAQAKEPAAFAFFALRAIEGKINHLPQTTGARHACVLGKIIPGSPAHAAS